MWEWQEIGLSVSTPNTIFGLHTEKYKRQKTNEPEKQLARSVENYYYWRSASEGILYDESYWEISIFSFLSFEAEAEAEAEVHEAEATPPPVL